MAKQNAFVKISGNLIKNKDVLRWLRALAEKHFVVICVGGGGQINDAFDRNNLDTSFGPLGRITKTLEERQIARDILEKNQALLQDLLDREGINARVVIPVMDISTVLCHVNGDVQILAAYNGFDRLFILTLTGRVREKEAWLRRIAECLAGPDEKELSKIKVVGFQEDTDAYL